jgi:hypothetical protein
MTTHVWRLPRLGCALQGLLPLLPPTLCVPAEGEKHTTYPHRVTNICHLIDDKCRENTEHNTKCLTETINNQLSFNR